MASSSFQAPRGTSDILPDDQPYWSYIRGTAASVAASFGYERIDTPIFEDKSLLRRGVGEEAEAGEELSADAGVDQTAGMGVRIVQRD